MSEEKNETTPEVVEPTIEEVVEEIAPAVDPEPIVEPVKEQEVIVVPEEDKVGKGLGNVANGTIGSTEVKSKTATKKKTEIKNEETVAVKSNRNISWDGVGRLKKGVNIVSKTDAEKWTGLKGVEILTPDQVAKEFDK